MRPTIINSLSTIGCWLVHAAYARTLLKCNQIENQTRWRHLAAIEAKASELRWTQPQPQPQSQLQPWPRLCCISSTPSREKKIKHWKKSVETEWRKKITTNSIGFTFSSYRTLRSVLKRETERASNQLSQHVSSSGYGLGSGHGHS